MSGTDRRRGSPERLTLKSVSAAEYFESDGYSDSIQVTAVFMYDPWASTAELSDAVRTVQETYERAAEEAEQARHDAIAAGKRAPEFFAESKLEEDQ